MIEKIDWEDIKMVWERDLWPGREDIRPMSSMLWEGGYDVSIYERYQPCYFAYIAEGEIAGVNSGHQTCSESFRSRGLFVYPKYRGQGLAQKLLEAVIEKSIESECRFTWSFPKKTASTVYHNAGYTITDRCDVNNCYALKYNA